MSRESDGTPVLRFTIEIPGIDVSDVEDLLAELRANFDADATLWEDIFREELSNECTVTLVGLPGEKCASDQYDLTAHKGYIVDAEVHRG